MPDLTNLQFPPPKDWQAFERLCADLWAEIWKDPNTQANGRTGQPQHGVDVFGRPNCGMDYAGVQCKGKEGNYRQPLTEKDLREEIAKAKSFAPAIKTFILATTASRDQNIQTVARLITIEHGKTGGFSVDVLGWEEIERRLSTYPYILEKHYPQYAPSISQLPKLAAEIQDNQLLAEQKASNRHQELQTKIAGIERLLTSSGTSIGGGPSDLVDEIKAEIDYCRDLIVQNRPAHALEILVRLKQRAWSSSDANARFRITTNIGAAKLSLQNNNEAAEDFITAYAIKSDEEKAICNLTLAYLLLDRDSDALVISRQAIQQFPNSKTAWALHINALTSCEPDTDPVALIPQQVKDSDEVCFAIAHFFRKRGNLAQALEWLTRAASNKNASHSDINSARATALVEQLIAKDCFFPGAPLAHGDFENLSTAKKLLEELWSKFRYTEIARQQLAHCLNLVCVYLVLENFDEAERIVDQGLIVDNTNTELLRHKIQLQLRRGDPSGAQKLLQSVPANLFPSQSLLMAEVLRELKKPAEALELLERNLGTAPIGDVLTETLIGIVNVTVEMKGFETALHKAREFLIQFPNEIRLATFAAGLANNAKLPEQVPALLTQASTLAEASGKLSDKLLLADAYQDCKIYDKAYEIYKLHAPTERDGRLLRRLLIALFETDRRREAINLIDSLPEEIRGRPFFEKLLGVIHERAGDLPLARNAFESFLQHNPHDFATRLRWIEILDRLRDTKPIREYLEELSDLSKFNVPEKAALTLLYQRYGMERKALEIGYETLCRFPDALEPNLAWLQMFFPNKTLPEEILKTDTIGEDSIFVLQNHEGKKSTYSISPQAFVPALSVRLAPDHPLAKVALGRRQGDAFDYSSNEFSKEVFNVLEVKHKYLYALHDSMEHFETRFPDSKAIMRVNLEGPPGSEGSLRPIFRALDKRAEKTNAIEAFYFRDHFPLCTVARLAGCNVIDLWRSFMSAEKFHLACCMGTFEEREEAEKLIRASKNGCILEPLSLFTIHALKVCDDISRLTGKLGVTQATLDVYRALIEDRKSHGPDGFMTLAKTGDQYVRQEISAEDIEKDIHRWEEVLVWAETNCEIIPAIAKEDPLSSQAKRLLEVLGKAFGDTLLAASGSGRLLISDDWYFRQVAKAAFGVNGVWLQVLLMVCQLDNWIDRNKYNDAVCSLLESNYDFVSIDANLLVSLARKEEWQVTPRFNKVASSLDLRRNELASALRVARRFLRHIWSSPIVTLSEARRLTFALFNEMNVARSQHCELVLAVLLRVYAASVGGEQYCLAIADWCRGHFIAYPTSGTFGSNSKPHSI